MDKVLYLVFCATNSLFYLSIKYMHCINSSYSTTEIAAYCNIVSLSLFSWYFIKNTRHIISGFKANLRIAISAPAALLKFTAIQYISPKNAMVVSFLTPVIVTMLAFITLKEEFVISDLKKYSWMILSFLGVLIFIGSDIRFSAFAYFLMLMHISAKAFIHIFTKQLSKDRYLVLFYGVLYNSVSTIIITLLRGKTIKANMFLDWKIAAIGIISVLCQFALIQAYRIAKRISFLQNLDYSRILFSSIGAYLLLSETIRIQEWTGMLIIMISVIGSQKQDIKNKIFMLLKNKYPLPDKKLKHAS